MEMMKLYHGTSWKNAEYIEKEGFVGGELSAMTSMKHVHGGVVYMAASIEEAAEYGEAIFEIDFDLDGCEQPEQFTDGNTNHWYSTDENINQAADYRRIR